MLIYRPPSLYWTTLAYFCLVFWGQVSAFRTINDYIENSVSPQKSWLRILWPIVLAIGLFLIMALFDLALTYVGFARVHPTLISYMTYFFLMGIFFMGMEIWQEFQGLPTFMSKYIPIVEFDFGPKHLRISEKRSRIISILSIFGSLGIPTFLITLLWKFFRKLLHF